jgi:Tfp pilus assembly protein FimT
VIELLVVVGILGLMAALALPNLRSATSGYRLTGDARTVARTVAVAKMRAAAAFTRVRLRADIGTGTFQIERWDTTATPNAWVPDGGVERLSSGVAFGFGGLTSSPPNTQGTGTIFHRACFDNATPPVAIAGTACIVFNSRGVPVDSTGAPLGGNAIYVTDGTAVYGAMVAATGLANLYWTPYRTPAVWQKQE